MKAKAKMNGLTFVPAPKFGDAAVAFGADDKDYFRRSSLPDVPRKYVDMAQGLFFSGGKVPAFVDSVDRSDALRAIRALLKSFAPSHEAKMATVGYALWAWIEGAEQ